MEKIYLPLGYTKCDFDEANCCNPRACHADIKKLGRYDELGGWEGFALTKCLVKPVNCHTKPKKTSAPVRVRVTPTTSRYFLRSSNKKHVMINQMFK